MITTKQNIALSDIDECATNADNCNDNATCTNTGGSFTCTCNSGYYGDGVTCNSKFQIKHYISRFLVKN